MKRAFSRGLVLATLASGFISTAQAVPIIFNFTGTVNSVTIGSPTPMGTAVTGGFTFETDRLSLFVPPSSPPSVNFLDWQPTVPVGSLDLGGRPIAFPASTGVNYASINFNDACSSPGVCYPNWSESFALYASSSDLFTPDVDGIYRTMTMTLISDSTLRFPDFPFFEARDYFDSTQVDPYSILSLPLMNLTGIFSVFGYECIAGACQSTTSEQVQFSIDSVDRYVGVRSVPEPGTAALLGAALAGMFLLRRRRPTLLPGKYSLS